MSFTLTEEDLLDEDLLCQKMIDLTNIVYIRHFYVNVKEKEDLISVGLVKAYSLLSGKQWAGEKGKLLNYLYTGIRNEMHNYAYKLNREVCCEDFYLNDGSISGDTNDFLKIDISVVQSVSGEFSFYGDLTDAIAVELTKKGFIITGWNYGGEDLGMMGLNEIFCTDLLNRLSGAVIWKSRECYR